MRRSSSLLMSVLTIVVIMISTIASIVLFGNALIANAQPSQLITSQPGMPQEEDRTFQSMSDSFSVLVPEGWVIQDANNTGFRLLAEVLQGYGILAQLCPQEQQQLALTNVGNATYQGSCQEAQENKIHIVRYPNLGARLGFASDDGNTTINNITTDDILPYQIQKLQEVGYKNISIVNSTDTTINVDISTRGINNNTVPAATVPAKLVELTYSTNFAPDQTRTGHFILTVTNATPRNLGEITGYSIFYEGNSTAATPAAETTMLPSGSLPIEAREVFDSFELIAAQEVAQAIAQAQTEAEEAGEEEAAELGEEEFTELLTAEIISNGTEGVAPATFEFEADVIGGTEPYTISWDFDDDGSEEESDDDEQTFLHTFEEAGTYNVTLTATDSEDQTAYDSIEINVEEQTGEEEDTADTTTSTTDDDNVPSTDATNGDGDQNDNEEVIVTIPEGASSLTDDAYSPNPVEVSIGDTVTWINDDFTSHTATSGTPDSGSTGMFGGTEDSPEIIEPEGGTQSYTFNEAGEFPYYCTLHPSMVGTVIVTEE
jgi:plastocyanin